MGGGFTLIELREYGKVPWISPGRLDKGRSSLREKVRGEKKKIRAGAALSMPSPKELRPRRHPGGKEKKTLRETLSVEKRKAKKSRRFHHPTAIAPKGRKGKGISSTFGGKKRDGYFPYSPSGEYEKRGKHTTATIFQRTQESFILTLLLRRDPAAKREKGE